MRRTFGTANSLASHDRNRMSMSFESIGGARLRISKHAKLVERGSKKKGIIMSDNYRVLNLILIVVLKMYLMFYTFKPNF